MLDQFALVKVRMLFLIALAPLLVHAQDQSPEIQEFPFQQSFSQGLSTFNGEYLGEFVGETPDQVCSQITPDIFDLYPQYCTRLI